MTDLKSGKHELGHFSTMIYLISGRKAPGKANMYPPGRYVPESYTLIQLSRPNLHFLWYQLPDLRTKEKNYAKHTSRFQEALR